MDRHGSKVYINPNFNSRGCSNSVPKPSMCHVNPAFSQVKLNTHSQQTQKSKIYINPNFMPSTSQAIHYDTAGTGDSSDFLNTPASAIETATVPELPPPISQSRYNLVRKEQKRPLPTASTSDSSDFLNTPASAIETATVPELPPPISQSRYNLVRKEQKRPLPTKTNETADKPKTTIRISKYKSITIPDVKKRLESVPTRNTEQPGVERKIDQMPKKYNKYKFLRVNSKTVNKDNISNPYRKAVSPKKYFLASRSKYKLRKATAGKMKTNNIPCPLFRKYGKCIRTEQGNCNFLHDKKHVSICRKFIKGLCFDVDCLLSHDLTNEKMPICHFYLKGACSKDDCPYLHIKHNENTSICTDFLKGYCEKGIECSKRHIDLCPDMATKGICSKARCPYPHRSKTLKRNASQRKSFPNKVKRIQQPKLLNKETKNQDAQVNKEQDNNKESRYYQEAGTSADNKDVCEIKPSRCKLGTLPSFIHL